MRGAIHETHEKGTPKPPPTIIILGLGAEVSLFSRVSWFVNGGGVCVIISFDLRDQISAVFYGKFIYSAIHTYNQELRANVSQPF